MPSGLWVQGGLLWWPSHPKKVGYSAVRVSSAIWFPTGSRPRQLRLPIRSFATWGRFGVFELILLLKLDKQLPVERFEATVSQSTVPSPLLALDSGLGQRLGLRLGRLRISHH